MSTLEWVLVAVLLIGIFTVIVTAEVDVYRLRKKNKELSEDNVDLVRRLAQVNLDLAIAKGVGEWQELKVAHHYMTVGVQYTQEDPHPIGMVHNQWVTIVCEDYEMARQIASSITDNHYSVLYDDSNFNQYHFDGGEFAKIVVTKNEVPA